MFSFILYRSSNFKIKKRCYADFIVSVQEKTKCNYFEVQPGGLSGANMDRRNGECGPQPANCLRHFQESNGASDEVAKGSAKSPKISLHQSRNHATWIFPLTLKIKSFIFNREMLRCDFQCSDWELLLIRHRCWGNDNHLLEDMLPQFPCLLLHQSSRPSSYSGPWESNWDALLGHSFYKFNRLKNHLTLIFLVLFVYLPLAAIE